eukprot:2258912-Rhodomonas_salina.1
MLTASRHMLARRYTPTASKNCQRIRGVRSTETWDEIRGGRCAADRFGHVGGCKGVSSGWRFCGFGSGDAAARAEI